MSEENRDPAAPPPDLPPSSAEVTPPEQPSPVPPAVSDSSAPATAPAPEAESASAPLAAPSTPEPAAAEPPRYEWLPPVIAPAAATSVPAGSEPTPPLLATTSPKPDRTKLIVAALGVVVCVLALVVIQTDPNERNAPYMIGQFMGIVTLWPLLIVGLLSIAPRFRTPRARRIVLSSVWAFVALGEFGMIAKNARETVRGTAVSSAVDEQAATATEAPAAAAPQKLTPAEAQRLAAGFDFTRGSDTRLIKKLESAQESTYRSIVEAYAAACQLRPTDAALALERVRFIERFAYAEDVTFAHASADLETAKQHLLTAFPHDPGKLLYELQSTGQDDFDEVAAKIQPAVTHWTAQERARFWLLRAQHTNESEAHTVETFAASSFQDQPTPEAALLLARALVARRALAEARETLQHPCFKDASEWTRLQRMNLLFDAGATQDAVAEFDALESTAPAMLHNLEVAQKLAQAGRLDLARKVYASVPVNQWNREHVTRQRFEFELAHGTATQASAAYRAMREASFESDASGRARLDLFLKHPGAPWGIEEIGSLFVFGLLLAAMAALPLLPLAPLHYWGMWRRLRGRLTPWSVTPWGLRHAYPLLAAICVALIFGVWLFNPTMLSSWMHENAPQEAHATTLREQLGPPTMFWIFGSLLCLWFVYRAHAWRLYGPGIWTTGRALGIGAVSALAIKMGTGVYVTVLGLENLGVAEITPGSVQFFKVAYDGLGCFGLFALVAIFVPLFEETVFRGVLLGALAKHVPFWVANLVQALCFLSMHEEMRLAPFFLAIALVNGVLVRRSGGLLAAIALHVTNNTIATLVIIAHGGNLPSL